MNLLATLIRDCQLTSTSHGLPSNAATTWLFRRISLAVGECLMLIQSA